MKTSPVDNTTEVMPRSGQNLFERACLCLSQPVWVLRIKPSPCFCLLPMTAKKQNKTKTNKKSLNTIKGKGLAKVSGKQRDALNESVAQLLLTFQRCHRTWTKRLMRCTCMLACLSTREHQCVLWWIWIWLPFVYAVNVKRSHIYLAQPELKKKRDSTWDLFKIDLLD